MRFERTRANERERSHRLDKLGVTGSSPVPPTSRNPLLPTGFVVFGPGVDSRHGGPWSRCGHDRAPGLVALRGCCYSGTVAFGNLEAAP